MLPNSGLNNTKPATEIDDENRVLLSIPSGKTSIASKNTVFTDRSGQKKGTCWYYAYSIIRDRYKDIEKISPTQANMEFHQVLLDAREKEKALSDYRKTLTNLNQRREVTNAFLGSFDTAIDKTKAAVILRRDTENKLDEGLKKLLRDFIDPMQDTTNNFKDFFAARNNKARIHASITVLNSLGVDHLTAANVMITQTYPGKKIEDLTLLETNTLYFYTVKQAALHAYMLHESTWIPGEGISGVKGLMDHLRTEGAMVTGGYNGLPYYKNTQKTHESMIGTRTVYDLKKENYDDSVANRGAHVICIIGAEIIGKNGYVYFIDPKDESKVKGERKTYRVEYNEFLAKLTNVNGINLIEAGKMNPEVKPPFAICSSMKNTQEMLSVVEKIVPDATNSHKTKRTNSAKSL